VSDLVVQDLDAGDIEPDYVNHNPTRTARFTAGSGTWTPAESVAFTPSGAAGEVVSFDTPTKTLTYYLLTGEPETGDTATGAAATATGCDLLVAAGDTFSNDGRTLLYVDNQSADPITVTVVAMSECSHGYLHDLSVVVPAGVAEPIPHPFDRQRFNLSGKCQVVYAGSDAAADLKVAAVRTYPI